MFLKLSFAFLLCLTGLRAAPNVIVILVDDMGYSDISPWGGEIETPHLEKLAKQGLRFTQFYNYARCCPTRAALMTGLAAHQAGIGHMTRETDEKASVPQEVPPAYAGTLTKNCTTMAQALKAAGYATMMTGKWHLSGKRLTEWSQDDWPLQRGFDRFYGLLHGASHHFNPSGVRIIYDGNKPVPEPQSTTKRAFYTTDAFADHAIRFIDEHKTSDAKAKPFFLYLAFTAPHWPIHAHAEDVEKYRTKYAIGWDQLREQRFARQQASGLIPPQWKMAPRDAEVPAWDSLPQDVQAAASLRMAAYAGMIDRLDQKIGDLLACLKKHGAYEDTLLLFLSDNGACAEGAVLGKGDPLASAAESAPGAALNTLSGMSYGRAWANASATPYRLYKHYAHEGGTNTPCIAHWPARMLATPTGRTWCRQPAKVTDILPTVLAAAGVENKLPNLDGQSLLPLLENKPLNRTAPLCMEHENNAFIRDGEWKLVGKNVAPPRGVQPQQWELYNMTADGTEHHNLAAQQPQRVQALAAAWEAWAKRVGVFPKPTRK